MKSRKTLCSLALLALLGSTNSSLTVLANTQTTTSEATTTTVAPTTTELPTTSLTTGTVSQAPTLPNTTVTTTTETTTVENPTTTTVDPATLETMFEKGIPVTESATSIAKGDDYPAYLKNIPYYSYTVDPWSYYHRQCTSFVAFRLTQTNKFNDVRMFGNATVWGTNAKKRGYTVNNKPAHGSVAWFSGGHVAWVSDVRGAYVEVEEYNVPFNSGKYSKRVIPIKSVTGFIHFKDLKPGKQVATQGVSLNKTAHTISAGSSFNLSATVKPTNASNKAVKWTSSNPKIATVSNGKVTAIAPGQATITVITASGSKKATAKITVQKAKPAPVYRLYNSGTKRHFYTKNQNEANTLKTRGWNFEGQKFLAAGSGTPVYRLYHPQVKQHLYTTNKNEYDILSTRGWTPEGIAWFSAGKKPIYRLYHTGLKIHLYTTDKNEVNTLVKRGWRNEKIAFYAQ